MRRLSLLLSLLFLLCACEKKRPPPPEGDPRPEIPPLPNLKIAYLKDVAKAKFASVAAPKERSLHWNLAEGRRFGYRLEQNSISHSSVDDRYAPTELRTSLRGDGIAEVVGESFKKGIGYYKMTPRESIVNGIKEPPDRLNKKPVAKSEYDVFKDGRIELARIHSGGKSPVLEMLFHLAPFLKQTGKTVRTPYSAISEYRMKGEFQTRITGYHHVERYICARIVTDIELNVSPVTLDGSGKGVMKGRIVSYFSIDRGCFVRATAALSLVYHLRRKTGDPERGERWIVATLETHTLLNARLK